MPWIRKRSVKIDKGGDRIRIGPKADNIVIRSAATFRQETAGILEARLVSAAAWTMIRRRKGGSSQVFAASMADINKALKTKIYTNLANKLSFWLNKYLLIFDYKIANTFSLFRDYNNRDYKINLIKIDQEKELEVP